MPAISRKHRDPACPYWLCNLQRSHIDREAILHIRLHQPVISLVHLLDRNDLNIRGEIVLPAEIKHLLGLGNPTDRRTRKTAPSEEQIERRNSQRLLRRSHKSEI